jgi:predicted nucleotidyltransferase
MQKNLNINLWTRLLKEKELIKEKEREKILKKTIEILKSYFSNKQVKAVYLIGSLINKGDFYNFSDIDIAVEDLREDYFKTLCELEELLPRRVDIIELENCSFKRLFLQKGLKIL